ncbi:hypothetical protein BaRGS_00000208 [Batillaria attramentaria]|uniref:Uncharacterized protein n=1 Tax=Batillaria attramentaria TaxID=370345 RepID=A0ABD0MBK6_9CAEN
MARRSYHPSNLRPHRLRNSDAKGDETSEPLLHTGHQFITGAGWARASGRFTGPCHLRSKHEIRSITENLSPYRHYHIAVVWDSFYYGTAGLRNKSG